MKRWNNFSALLGAFLVLTGCREARTAPALPAPPVTVAEVEQRTITEWDEFIGRFEAVESVEIRPRVSGYIDRVAFAEGKEVRKGDLLFQIDPRPYQAELARAEAELAQARSAGGLAARNLERSKTLAAGEAISHEELDNRGAVAERGAAAIRAAQAAVASARLNLEWTRVRSPIRGRVGRAEVTVGNLVQAGAAPRLTTVVSLDPMYVYFDADERSYLKYVAHRGSGRAPVAMGMANDDGAFPYQGHLDFVDNQLDPRSGTVRARAVFSNKDQRFTPGLFARLRLFGTVEYRPIQLGRVVDGYRVVSSGLKPGEKIVVNGLQRVRPGMKVTPTAGPMLAQAAAER
jgi:RND family efflux transporter MFP subunit